MSSTNTDAELLHIIWSCSAFKKYWGKRMENKGGSKRERGKKRGENEIQSVENWVLNWPGVCLSPKRWSRCNENGIPDAYEGRLFPILIPLSKKTSLFLKVIVAVIRERVLLRVTAKGLRGSGWLDNLVPIPASLPSSWASPPLACSPARLNAICWLELPPGPRKTKHDFWPFLSVFNSNLCWSAHATRPLHWAKDGMEGIFLGDFFFFFKEQGWMCV